MEVVIREVYIFVYEGRLMTLEEGTLECFLYFGSVVTGSYYVNSPAIGALCEVELKRMKYDQFL